QTQTVQHSLLLGSTDSSRVEEYSVFDFLTILPTSPQVRICGAPSLCYCSAIESMCYKIIKKDI
uniref:Uncharacterized protein n=2 Tax=Magallana gigas TaxID=29159 RepID=A0A8W8IYA5_MAGGI